MSRDSKTLRAGPKPTDQMFLHFHTIPVIPPHTPKFFLLVLTIRCGIVHQLICTPYHNSTIDLTQAGQPQFFSIVPKSRVDSESCSNRGNIPLLPMVTPFETSHHVFWTALSASYTFQLVPSTWAWRCTARQLNSSIETTATGKAWFFIK